MRQFLLSISVILVILFMFTISSNFSISGQSTKEFGFNLEGVSASFQSNATKSSVTVFSPFIFMQLWETNVPISISLNTTSNDKINQIQFYNANNNELIKELKFVKSLQITSDVIMIRSNENLQHNIETKQAGLEAGENRLGFHEASRLTTIVPNGKNVIQFAVGNNSRILVDNKQVDINIPAMTMIIEFESNDGWIIQTNEVNSHITATDWNNVEIDSYGSLPISITVYDVKGTISTDKPIRKTVNLNGADNLELEQTNGEFSIKRLPEKKISINARGYSSSVLINDENIDKFEEVPWWNVAYDPWIVNIGTGIVLIIIGGIGAYLFKSKRRPHYNLIDYVELERFFERNIQHVRIRNSGTRPIKNCSILGNDVICPWWDNQSIEPRNISSGGGGNVQLLSIQYGENPKITIKSGKKKIHESSLNEISLSRS